MTNHKICIIGGGNMGISFARAILNSSIVKANNLSLIDRSYKKKLWIGKELKCKTSDLIDKSLSQYGIVVLAVKPQDAAPLLKAISPHLTSSQIVVSFMTGIKLKDLQGALNNHTKIVRAMPNLPAQIGKGFTVYKSSGRYSKGEEKLIKLILDSAGASLKIASEDLLDAATAIPATGPGYLFYFFEHLIQAAIDSGFSKKDSELIIKETVAGSLHLWIESGLTPQQLRAKVTSKGGTTKAAIDYYDRAGLDKILKKGIQVAEKRAKELSRALVK